jgi:chromosome segregation and condensation protein ScpB
VVRVSLSEVLFSDSSKPQRAAVLAGLIVLGNHQSRPGRILVPWNTTSFVEHLGIKAREEAERCEKERAQRDLRKITLEEYLVAC